MGDPVERVKRFVETQQQQARHDEAKVAWTQKIGELLPHVESVVDVMRDSLVNDQFVEPAISVLSDPKRDQFPLVIAFGARTARGDNVLVLRPDQVPVEAGASALFRCEADGHVHGYRYPFHAPMLALPPDPFVDLGEPAHIDAAHLGHAVADFLEWASGGGGCNGHELHFGAPATLPFLQPGPKLTIRAA